MIRGLLKSYRYCGMRNASLIFKKKSFFQYLNFRNFNTSRVCLEISAGQPNIYRRPVRLRDLLKDPSGQARRALLISFVITLISMLGWKGTHMYIEYYLHPTNPELSSEVRSYLRGAFLREEIEPDPALAEEYLILARDHILENEELEATSLEFIKLNIRLADIYKTRKRYLDAIHLYIQSWHSLASSTKADPEWQLKKLEGLNLGLSIGQLCLKMGESTLAKYYLTQGFETIQKDLQETPQSFNGNRKLSVDYRLALGGAFALQGDFGPALSLYKSALDDIIKEKPISGLHPWGCVEALVLNYISEVTYAKTKDIDQSLLWAWRSHKASAPFQNITLEGDATYALTLQTLGNLYDKQNDKEQAIACLSNAILSAEKACDSDLTHSIGLQLARLQPETQ